MTEAAEALQALARDLVEEIASARALELAYEGDPEALELAVFNVRGFSRNQRIGKTGKVIREQVRPHPEQRSDLQHPGSSGALEHPGDLGALHFVRGEPSHFIANTSQPAWLAGQQEWEKHYSELHAAHKHGVEQVLPAARTPEEKQAVHERLDKIQGRMEDLDKAAGVHPQATRKLLGSRQEQGERAQRVTEAVEAVAGQQKQREVRAAQVPPPPKGAAAVHPQLGGHLARLPGETVAQAAYSHVPRPVPVQTPSPEARALEQAGRRIEGYAQREGQRRAADLKEHLQELRDARLAAQGIAPPGTYQPLSDEEFTLHVKNLEDLVSNALDNHQDTEAQFSRNGVWDSDRAAVHSEIVRDFLDKQVNVPSQHQAMLMGGMPGAGKSSVLKSHPNPLLDLKNFAAINPDDFKEELAKRGMVPELPGLSPLEASALIHEESSHLFELALAELTRRGKNVALDLTMKTERTTRGRVDKLKELGYNPGAVFVDIPVAESARRTESRYRHGLERYRKGTQPLGARHVPKHVLEASEAEPGVSAPRKTFEALKPEFSWWEHWDNSGKEKVLVSTSGTPATSDISSAEELAKQAKLYVGSTEAQARAAEKGIPAS